MPSVCVVGAQWGDEGKAGIVDLLSVDADWVVRFQGGANAGHTVVVGEETFKLHLVPSGIVREGGPKCLIGQGVVVDPEVLFTELDELEARGVATEGRIFVSDRAHLLMPYHRVLDGLREDIKEGSIGTTRRGIGPCYADKVSYRGIRVADLLDPAWFDERLRGEVAARNRVITQVFGADPLDYDEMRDLFAAHRMRLEPMVIDGVRALGEAYELDEKILYEGAQGLLLDVDNGTYPYVTGSNASVLGLPSGAGIPPRRIGRAIGVSKAYCTRVGDGPFPTEDHGAEGEEIRRRGNEYGTTTGRPRRCGWFDAVAGRYAAQVSGFDELAITKLDILSGIEVLKLAVAYEHEGRRITTFPARLRVLEEAEPVYESFPGFEEDLGSARTFDDLPATAKDYLKAIEDLVGVPIRIVSVGPERDQVVRSG
jgi:adenylosuccinate synthase